MKPLIIPLGIILVSVNLGLAQVPTNGLAAYYPFNGNANDSSGKGNNGMADGATLTTDRFGNANSAYAFDAAGSEISIPDSASLDPASAMSISAWFKCKTPWTNHSISIVTKGLVSSSIPQNGYFLYLNQNASEGDEYDVGVLIMTSLVRGQIAKSFIPYADLAQWNHLVGVIGDDTLRCYLNGIEVAKAYAPGSILQGNTDLLVGGTNNPDYIAMNPRNIDDVRIYNRALNESEIAVLYHEGGWNSLNQWTVVNTGLTNPDVRALAVSATNLFAGTHLAGVFRSTDNGANWTAINSGLSDTIIYSLAVSDTNLFAATGGYYTGATHGGVYRSTNNGTSWNMTGLADGYVTCLVASSPNVYAGTFYDGVYLSIDNGTSWTAVNNGLPLNISALALASSIPLVGTYGDGVFRSTNRGLSWNVGNDGLTNLDVLSLVVSGAGLFAGTEGGVFLSTSLGMIWTSASNGLTNTYINCLGVSGTDLFAGTDSGGVFLSTDNGASWGAINSGLTDPVVNSLVVSGTYLFAGTPSGVYRRSLSETLPIQLVSFTAASTSGSSVILHWTTVSEVKNYGFMVYRSASMTGGFTPVSPMIPGYPGGNTIVPQSYKWIDNSPNANETCYRLRQYDMDGSFHDYNPIQANLSPTSVDEKQSVPKVFQLSQNYPNPFNPSTTIRYGLPQRAQVSLKVYNTLGQLVTTLVNVEQGAGYHEVKFDGSNLASGVYFYRLQAETYVETRKFLLLR